MWTVCRPPPVTNVPRAWSTSAATSEGSGATDSVPLSIRPASSRSLSRPSMRSACSSMMRKNCATSAGPKMREPRSTVAAEPLIEVSGARSSWLTMPRKSARMRSRSRSGARSCMVTTTEATAPSGSSGPWIGVALTSVVRLRPSGTENTISSARNASAPSSTRASGTWSNAISRPSENRQVSVSNSCSRDWSGRHRLRTRRLASRLSEIRSPFCASHTATPTGEISIRASRRARARCSWR